MPHPELVGGDFFPFVSSVVINRQFSGYFEFALEGFVFRSPLPSNRCLCDVQAHSSVLLWQFCCVFGPFGSLDRSAPSIVVVPQ